MLGATEAFGALLAASGYSLVAAKPGYDGAAPHASMPELGLLSAGADAGEGEGGAAASQKRYGSSFRGSGGGAGVIEVLDWTHGESGRKAQVVVCSQDPLASAQPGCLSGLASTLPPQAWPARCQPPCPTSLPCPALPWPQSAPGRFDLSAAATWWDGRQLATLEPELTDR